ncbi:MAG TPA: YkvA family protein [Ohtaekwangia sp.]
MKKNVFFDMALNKASSVLGKKGRLLILLTRLGTKLRSVKMKDLNVKEKFFILGRLLKAYALGKYREIPWKTLLLVTAAVLYFVNPIDLIPDWIPGIGFTDDLGILMSVYASINSEIDKFLTWEKSQVSQS